MGCDIHSFVAVLGDDGTLSPSETYVNLSDQRFYNEVELKLRKKKEYSNDDWLNI